MSHYCSQMCFQLKTCQNSFMVIYVYKQMKWSKVHERKPIILTERKQTEKKDTLQIYSKCV